MKISQIALLGAAGVAVAQPHGHAHQHMHKHLANKIEARADVTEVVQGPTVTKYVMDGEVLPASQVEAGISAGRYVVISESEPTFTPSTIQPSSTSTSSASSSTSDGGQFFQHSSSSSSSSTTSTWSSSSSSSTSSSTSSTPTPTPSTSSTPTPTPTPSSTSTPTPSSTVASSSSSSAAASAGPASFGSGQGITASFPSGQIACSQFPSDYGALAVEWQNLNGWISVQQTSGYTFGVSASIANLANQPSGGCQENSFCSYACPPGYQKSQWPTAQGSTGQSVGGLWCNSDGMLEMTNSDYDTLCIPGAGGVSVFNNLSQNAAICRTNYPGDEAETVPQDTQPGTNSTLCNPDSSTYYHHEGAPTSAQYYINNAGVSVEEACVWGVSGSDEGNWAPVNAGVGYTSGTTFISLFPNAPTNPDGVLNFNVYIKGDVSADCKYVGGQYYQDGVESPTGCTVGATGNAWFEFSEN